MTRFRDSLGRWATKYFFAQELKGGLVSFKDADGKRLKGKKSVFIIKTNQEYYSLREKKREKWRYKKRKKEKVLGIKIIEPEFAPEIIEVGLHGGQKKYEPKFTGSYKTYVRWSFKTRRLTGSDGISGRNAKVFGGNVSFNEALELSDFNYYFRDVRGMILAGELTLLEGGIHFYHFREDEFGYKRMIGDDTYIEGSDILSV